MAMNVLINVGALAAGFIPLAFVEKPGDPTKQTSIAIGVGSGGSVPHVAVFDEAGKRVTQFRGDANGHICAGETWQAISKNDQNDMQPANPTYISIVMQENDAICISSVVASGNNQQWTWTGDMAYTCGVQWMESKYTFGGNSNVPIRCAWIDHDHTNNIVAKGISMHIRDFTGDPGLLAQYQNNTDRLCKNSARLTFQPEPIIPDSFIPFFSRELEYLPYDLQNPYIAGGLKDPDLGIDRSTSGYPDFTNMNIGKGGRVRRAKRSHNSKVKGIKNFKPGTLIVSHFDRHSAKEMCEHPNSLGPDFVSVAEGVYCDMETAKWWPLCDSTHIVDCFDLGGESLILEGPRKRGVAPLKQYVTHEEWGLVPGKRALLPRHKKKPGDRCNPKE